MIKKVLVAIDGSDHSAKAVALGADIAAKYNAELLLVHVLLHQELSRDLRHLAEVEHLTAEVEQPMPAVAGLPVGDLSSYFHMDGDGTLSADVLRALGNRILDKAERTALDHGAGKIVKRIEDGKAVDRILEIAEAEHADLIVSGARGLSDMKSLILGSVSHKLAQLSPVTCLTVR